MLEERGAPAGEAAKDLGGTSPTQLGKPLEPWPGGHHRALAFGSGLRNAGDSLRNEGPQLSKGMICSNTAKCSSLMPSISARLQMSSLPDRAFV